MSASYNEFTTKEKTAMIRSLLIIAFADGHINYSESQYIQTTILYMLEDESIIQEAQRMTDDEMARIIQAMSCDKKETVATIWLQCASKSMNSNIFGKMHFSDFPESEKIALKLSKLCNVDISYLL